LIEYLLSIGFPLIFFILLGEKWEIPRVCTIAWSILMGFLSFLIWYKLTSLYFNEAFVPRVMIPWVITVIFTALVLAWRFFRDPERIPPEGDNNIISPADGHVIYIKKINEGEFPFVTKHNRTIPIADFISHQGFLSRGVQIGISMNFLDVHVNRCPISGVVDTVKRVTGRFSSLKNIESLLENERVFTIINGHGVKVGIVQIASRLVRRIVYYLQEGDTCKVGQRMGMIRFGSQVDLLIPDTQGLLIQIKIGQVVRAGVTVIASH